MGGPPSDGSRRDELLREVHSIQRRSVEWQHFWESFCDVQGDGIRDPRRHSVTFLQRFVRAASGSGSSGEAPGGTSQPAVIGAAPSLERELRGGGPREVREPREHRDSREHREARELRESREPRELREPREPRERTGVVDKDKGNYGFIQQDSSDEAMFVMPASCHGFGGVLPPLGTRVAYIVVTDQKTGRLRAEDVRPASKPQARVPSLPVPPPVPHSAREGRGSLPDDARWTGTMEKHKGTFGFIRQDATDDNLFLMPSQCEGFGGALPAVGTRVTYAVGVDPKSGKPRAEGVQPLASAQDPQTHPAPQKRPRELREPLLREPFQPLELLQPRERSREPLPREPLQARGGAVANREPLQPLASEERTGTMDVDKGNFGFIRQDNGEDPMFVLPPLPAVGMRVVYRVVLDQKTGRPRADDVRQLGKSQASARRTAHPQPPQKDSPPPAPPQPPQQPSLPQSQAQQHSGTRAPAAAAALPAPPPKPGSTPGRKRRRVEGELAGTMAKDKGTFGFIEQDSDGEHLFVMPSSCEAFGGTLPQLGTRVAYRLGTDPKSGRSRAEDVRPEEDGPADEDRSGTMETDKGKFGFIKQDCGEDPMFVLPVSCSGFGGALPKLGARVVYRVVRDQKTNRLRAEDVQPEAGAGGPLQEALHKLEDLVAEVKAVQRRSSEWQEFWHRFCDNIGGGLYDPRRHDPPFLRRFLGLARDEENRGDCWAQGQMHHRQESRGDGWASGDHRQEHRSGGSGHAPAAPTGPLKNAERRGTMDRDKGSFGFIVEDRTQDHVFVMPGQCEGFGSKLPPVGARVMYWVADDPKSGRPRAEDVWPEDDGRRAQQPARAAPRRGEGHPEEEGRWEKRSQLEPWVQYSKDDGRWEKHSQPKPWVQHTRPQEANDREERYGIMDSDKGNFGFIKQDSGEEPMFVLPPLPPVGTRVAYRIILDTKTGRPRADDVRPVGGRAHGSGRGRASSARRHRRRRARHRALAASTGETEEATELLSGTFDRDKGTFGFILQDCDSEHMFVMPSQCQGWGGALPALGTRVVYRVGQDPKTGKYRAQDVQPEPDQQEHEDSDPEDEEHHGIMDRDKGTFGFIRPDGSDEHMFVLPTSCHGFEQKLPSEGTRVVYFVIKDHKTGRLRAEDVRPEPSAEEEDAQPEAGAEEEHPSVQDLELDAGAEEEAQQDPGADEDGPRRERPAEEDMERDMAAEEEPSQLPTELVEEVNAIQNRSDKWKAFWHSFCDERGGGVYDPTRHDASFLEQFLGQVRSEEEAPKDDAGEEGSPGDLLARVQEAQEVSPEVWNAFCDREGGGVRDPRKHAQHILQHFLDDIYFYVRCSGSDGARQGDTKRVRGSEGETREPVEAPPRKLRRPS